MEICKTEKCTGCYACINVCPWHCISMQEDKYGEIHPLVDERKCKKCNLCIKICPNNTLPKYHYPLHCYASWITNKEKRRICASGGIGTILSEYIIRYKHGVVFGTAYDKNFIPCTTHTESIEVLEKFKGSKYVQSIVGEKTFQKMKSFLEDNRVVLYIGTPCQIAGLKNYLRKDYANLLTVDLICHGVCPTKYFKEEVDYIVKKKHIEKLSDVRFRGNDGNDFCFTLWTEKNGKLQCCYRKNNNNDFYLTGFLLGVSLRENCYSCNYARPDRVSDITIGDFINLGKKVPFKFSKRNVSSVTTNTIKGDALWKEIMTIIPELRSYEREYSERLEYKPSLVEPFKRHKLNSVFRASYLQWGYLRAIRKVLHKHVRRNKIMRCINAWTLIYRIPRKLVRLIREFIYKYGQ